MLGERHVGTGGGFGGSEDFDLSLSKRSRTLRTRLKAFGGGFKGLRPHAADPFEGVGSAAGVARGKWRGDWEFAPLAN